MARRTVRMQSVAVTMGFAERGIDFVMMMTKMNFLGLIVKKEVTKDLYNCLSPDNISRASRICLL